MKLDEIESKISALRKRYQDLDDKSFVGGRWDGGVMSAMSAVDAEIQRLYGLREKALISDLIDEEPPKSSSSRAPAPALPLPRDLKVDPGDEVDPTEGLDAVPTDGESFGKFREKLLNFTLYHVIDYLKTIRSAGGGQRPVAYTQGMHWGILGYLAVIQTEMRTFVALGRDRRNEVEKKLLARIEALEARPSLKYAGIWNDKSVYGEANVVTDAGSMWHANRASVGERPGASDSWTLVVKRGANGKDAK